jgi:RNA polymerase sigma factor (sigma-70 family)
MCACLDRDFLMEDLFRLRPNALRFLRKQGMDHDTAEDLFSEALVAFAVGFERFDAGSPREAKRRARNWFWGILRNKVRMHFRSASRMVRQVPERAKGPDTAQAEVRVVLRRLPRPHAEVLVSRFLEGADLAMVADRLGVSVPTAHRRVRQALQEARVVA